MSIHFISYFVPYSESNYSKHFFKNYQKNASICFKIHTETKECNYFIAGGHLSKNSAFAHASLPFWWHKNTENKTLSYWIK